MIAGRLKHRIVVEHYASMEENFLGEDVREAVSHLPLRADVKWGAARCETSNMELVYSYEVSFLVWLHYRDKISEGDIVIYAGKKYRIISLEPDPDLRILYIRAQTA